MTRYPLTVDGAVELAVVDRGGFDESRHIGAAVVVDASGNVLRELGDGGASIYPRSSMKPFQALAVRRSGAVFRDAELALSSASHAGSLRHQEVVSVMLAAHGNTEDDLGCPPAYPLDPDGARLASGERRLAMNCSGKHAAMLAACRVNGWDLASYLDPAHPLQTTVIAVVQEFMGERIDHTAPDGCGAPVFPVTLRGLAGGIGRLVNGGDPDTQELVAAVLANPWAIDGEGRADTTVIESLGVYSKGGAEGVMTMGVPGGPAVAVKTLDGSPRAGTLAALTLLVSVGALDADAVAPVLEKAVSPVLGRGKRVGRVRPGAALTAR